MGKTFNMFINNVEVLSFDSKILLTPHKFKDLQITVFMNERRRLFWKQKKLNEFQISISLPSTSLIHEGMLSSRRQKLSEAANGVILRHS